MENSSCGAQVVTKNVQVVTKNTNLNPQVGLAIRKVLLLLPPLWL